MDGLRLDGRVAVVTGGAGAIGTAIAADLTGLGAEVVIADVDLTNAGKVKALHLHLDLASPRAVEEFAGAVGKVDILVHNAGVAIVEPFIESDPAGWDLMWQVNLRGPMLLTKLLLPGMMARGWGRLVFVSSDGARAGSGGEGAYAATKAGLFGLAKTLAREAARAHVTANVVCPGPTDTPMLRRVSDAEPGLVDRIARAIPLRRLGTPADVAGLVAYLCTERAAYITGQTLSVSGGVTMH
ncbi:SDR family oxidoreductase [Nonomuraea gerenzanensis]|uniref:3-oxoacyl-[acyl-carrier protein] reductase n=2 Tax=Nonomuraea gerenzanensis TaxID=93944 RepID=A0A1M4E315_9ACTN|nr:SDR family NAD(P)-dependent oxidoreductase [Nonomuraea gerenzanensis]UBU18816.1 SDR family oxidoreductase [Nonomuraea gerenzanensis]SBO93235.1 3-oxoacyl-[acyl-carrier protein] reductase [Nonomuraea gerenzanensis]